MKGDRWVNICSFGLTVSALANLTATLLLGPLELGGPGGLFYFYSYFLIFLAFGAIYWPMFISRNQVRTDGFPPLFPLTSNPCS